LVAMGMCPGERGVDERVPDASPVITVPHVAATG